MTEVLSDWILIGVVWGLFAALAVGICGMNHQDNDE